MNWTSSRTWQALTAALPSVARTLLPPGASRNFSSNSLRPSCRPTPAVTRTQQHMAMQPHVPPTSVGGSTAPNEQEEVVATPLGTLLHAFHVKRRASPGGSSPACRR